MRATIALIMLLLPAPAVAGETAWQEVAPGVRLRLIADDVRAPDGTTSVALEIDMPADTKTYWRVPGEGGIPASIEIAGSSEVAAVTPVWPYPRIDTTAGYHDYVYYGPTVVPLDVAVTAEPAELKASVTLGICSDICIPAMADFVLPLTFAEPDLPHQIRIRQAEARAPLPWDGPSAAIAHVMFDAGSALLMVHLGDPRIDPSTLIADMGPAGPVFGAPQKSPEGNVVTLPLLGGGDGAGLEGQSVQLTFLTPDGAYETTRTIGAE